MKAAPVTVAGLVVAAFMIARPLASQTTGRIEGRVLDIAGEPLPGVTVTISSPRLQGAMTAVTQREGGFRFLSLPPGDYGVVAQLDGFNPSEVRGARVLLDRTVVLEFTLSEVVADAITVTGEAPILDTVGTVTGAAIPEEVFSELPTTRTFQGLASVVAGVNESGLGNNPSIRGASALENRYVVDGLDITDPVFGNLSSSLSFEFVEEVEVKTGAYQAEYGGALGGVLNVITKSGSNELRGDAFSYYHDDSLQASGPSTLEFGQSEGLTQLELGLDLGGKLIEDELWYFAALNRSTLQEDLRTRQGLGFTTESESLYYAANLRWRISPSHSLVASFFGDPTDVTDAAGFDRFVLGDELNAAGLILHDGDSGANSFNLRYEGVPRGNLFLEASAGRYDQSASFTAIDGSQPAYFDYVGGAWAREQGCGDPDRLYGQGIVFVPGCRGGAWMWNSGDRSRDQLRASLSWLRGPHELKVGAEARDLGFDDDFHLTGPSDGPLMDALGTVVDPDGVRGAVFEVYEHDYDIFDWDQNLLAEGEELTFFVQDRWRVTPHFTLNLGVRLDSYEAWAPGVEVDPHRSLDFGFEEMIAPRIGFAWDLSRSGRSKLFGHLGRFFESVPIDLAARSFAGDSWAWIHIFANPADGSLPSYENPGIYLFTLNWDTIAPVDPDLEPQHTDEAVLGFEYEVRSGWVASATAVYRELRDAFQLIALDTRGQIKVISNQGGMLTVHPITGEPLPEPVYFAEPERKYRALELTLNRRFRDSWQLFGSYVYSKHEGNFRGLHGGGERMTPHATGEIAVPGAHAYSYGLLDNDRPHQLKLYGSRLWGFGMVTGFFGQYVSGTPIDKTGGHRVLGRRYVAPRGSGGRVSDTWRLDLHLGYPITLGGGFELELMVDLFNATNEQRAIEVNERWTYLRLFQTEDPNECGGPGTGPGTGCPAGNPEWGAPVSFQQPRKVRLAAKLSW